MTVLLALALFSFVSCFILTPVCRNLFVRAGLVDHPDTDRKFHLRPVPRVGGVAIVIAYSVTLCAVLFLHPGGRVIYIQHQHLLFELLPAAGLVFLTGLLDDLVNLKPWQKLSGLTVAAALAVALGARFSTPHLPSFVCVLLSFLWLIACTNAVNLIDGMDGLATGVGLLATLTTLAVALLTHNIGLMIATVPLAGCLFAFLFFNFSPATVFLGDCGSLTIGFALGCMGLIWSQYTGNLIGMAAPLVTFALPLIDVGLAIFRRFLRSRPIFQGDRGHIHHMILRSGVSTRVAAFILYGVSVMFATLGILMNFSRHALAWIVLGFFSSIVIVGIDRLGYVEFAAAAKTISQRRMRKEVKEQIYLEELSRALAGTDSLESWWQIACNTCRELGFATFELNIDGQTWQEEYVQHSGIPSCRIYLGMEKHGSIVLTTPPGNVPEKVMMAALECLQSSFPARFDMSAPRSAQMEGSVQGEARRTAA